MTKKVYALAALALAATPSFATDLWNQQVGLPASFNGVADQVITDLPLDSVYEVSDVVVGAGGWNVTTISMEIIANPQSTAAVSVSQAVLNFFPNPSSNALPTAANDPTAGTTVAVSLVSLGGNIYRLTASGLNLHWNAGEYWVGLTGIDAFANAQIYNGYTTTNAAGALHFSAADNPGGGLTTPGWQGSGKIDGDPNTPNIYTAIDVQGTAAPEPASVALLGLGIVGIVMRRRNRK